VVVGRVLDLEGVESVARQVVGRQDVVDRRGAVAVHVEVVAHPQREALDIERGDALGR